MRTRHPKGHGTEARYRRHLRNGEQACQACKDAVAAAVADRRRIKRSEAA